MFQPAAQQDAGNDNHGTANKPTQRSGGHEVPEAGGKEIKKGHGKHELPCKVHQLVHAQAGEGPANPDEDGDDGEQFCEEPDVGWNPCEEGEWRGPSAEEEGDGHSAGGKHTDIFAQKEEGEFKAGVFRVVAGDDLGFAFGQVEWRAVGFCRGGDHEEDKPGEAPGSEDEPVRPDSGVSRLKVDDGDGGERAGLHDDDDGGKNQRDLVADHLRDGAHGPEQGVLASAGPSGHEDGQFHHGADGEEVEDSGVEIDEHHISADGENRIAQERRRDQKDRRQKMHRVVRGDWDDVFLGERLDAVGDGLQEAAGADAVWPVAVLDAAQALALEPGGECEQRSEDDNDGRNRQDGRAERMNGGGEIAQQPVCGKDEDLIELLRQGNEVGHRGPPVSGCACVVAMSFASEADLASAAAFALASCRARSAARRASTAAASVG